MWDPRVQGIRHTTVFTVGFNRTFTGSPAILFAPRRSRGTIRGRVFRDMNVNGSFNTGEPGLPGVRVELSTGQTALTDREGRFEFSGLAADVYQVTLPLSQFTEPVRVTGSTELRVELPPSRIVEVDFGVVNFARVMGNVFNDYLLSGKKLPDAPGLRGITVILSNPTTRRAVTTDAGGDYEMDDLGPGTYRLAVDHATIPPDFVDPRAAVTFSAGPTETVVQDIPLRALRSIAGRVFLKYHNGKGGGLKIPGIVNGPSPGSEDNATLEPLAGVKLAVDGNTTITGTEGDFLLRNLPAGEVVLTMVPPIPVPAGVNIPSWRIRLPRDPIQVQGATIIISNPDLLRYLVLEKKAELRPATGQAPIAEIERAERAIVAPAATRVAEAGRLYSPSAVEALQAALRATSPARRSSGPPPGIPAPVKPAPQARLAAVARPAVAPVPQPRAVPAPPPPRAWQWGIWVSMGILVVGLGGGGLYYIGHRRPRRTDGQRSRGKN
jgi:hypothetical protein